MDKNNLRAVPMTRAIRDAHYEQLKDMTRQERIAFYRKKARLIHAKAQSKLHDMQGSRR